MKRLTYLFLCLFVLNVSALGKEAEAALDAGLSAITSEAFEKTMDQISTASEDISPEAAKTVKEALSSGLKAETYKEFAAQIGKVLQENPKYTVYTSLPVLAYLAYLYKMRDFDYDKDMYTKLTLPAKSNKFPLIRAIYESYVGLHLNGRLTKDCPELGKLGEFNNYFHHNDGTIALARLRNELNKVKTDFITFCDKNYNASGTVFDSKSMIDYLGSGGVEKISDLFKNSGIPITSFGQRNIVVCQLYKEFLDHLDKCLSDTTNVMDEDLWKYQDSYFFTKPFKHKPGVNPAAESLLSRVRTHQLTGGAGSLDRRYVAGVDQGGLQRLRAPASARGGTTRAAEDALSSVTLPQGTVGVDGETVLRRVRIREGR